MKITISSVQFCPLAGDTDENLGKIAGYVSRAKKEGARLVVLPEVSDIGYHLETIKRMAEPFPNRSTKRLSAIAKENGVVLVAGLAERRGEVIFNTAVVFDSDGKIVHRYDKTHLCPFPSLNEPAVFAAGSSIGTADVEGIRMGVSICYDCRFPELYRKLALQGAQIVAHPSAFPGSRIDQLEVCLRARAVEDQFFIASANFCGKIFDAKFGGRSMIIGPGGELLAKAGDTDEGVITAALDLGDMERLRNERPVLSRRRPELY